MNLNNKGQSLVLFVLLIPILLLIMTLVIDIGNLSYYKQELDNINKLTLDYGLDNIENSNVVNDMISLSKENMPNIKIEIKFNDQEFLITSTYYVKGIFTSIINKKGYTAKSSYKAYLDKDDKHIIKRIK